MALEPTSEVFVLSQSEEEQVRLLVMRQAMFLQMAPRLLGERVL